MTLAVVVNPSAGGGRGTRVLPRLRAELAAGGIDCRIFVTRSPAHVRATVARQANASYDGWVAVGGDGTNFQLLNGLLKSQRPGDLPPLGIIPVGSGNSFARDLGIVSAADGIRAVIGGRTRPVDVARLTQGGRPLYFVNMTGVGFVARVARTAHRLKWLGDLSYLLGVLVRLAGLRHHNMELELDGRRIVARNCFVEVCNSRCTGGKMLMAPQARIDDGWLDVVVVGPLSRLSLLAAFPTIYQGTHGDHPMVQVFRARRAVIRTDPPQPLLPDGEVLGATPTEITIHPKKVRYFA